MKGKENADHDLRGKQPTETSKGGRKRQWILRDEEEGQQDETEGKKRCQEQHVESEEEMSEVVVDSLQWPNFIYENLFVEL